MSEHAPVSVTPAKLRADVESAIARLSEPAPGKFAAMPKIDWSKVTGGLDALDALVQKALPVANTLLPAQYKLLVDSLAVALHGIAAAT